MDEKEFKKCLKIHGYVSSEEDSESDSKTKLDDIFEAFKPPPIQIDPLRHKIIEIGAPGNSKQQNDEMLSKGQKKRQRKRMLKVRQNMMNDTSGETYSQDFFNDVNICSNSSTTEQESLRDATALNLHTELTDDHVVENGFKDEERVTLNNAREETRNHLHPITEALWFGRQQKEFPPITNSDEWKYMQGNRVKNGKRVEEEIQKDAHTIPNLIQESLVFLTSTTKNDENCSRFVENGTTANNVQDAKKKRKRRKRSKIELFTTITRETELINPNPNTQVKANTKPINENSKSFAQFVNTPATNRNFQDLLKPCEKLFDDFIACIKRNPEDALGISRNVGCYIKQVQTLGVRMTKGILCVGTIIKVIGLRYGHFLKELEGEKDTQLTVDEFFYDLNTVIVETVLQEPEWDLLQPMTVMGHFFFDSLNVVLFHFSEMIVLMVWNRTGSKYQDPFAAVRPKIGIDLYNYSMWPIINLAKSIQAKRLDCKKGKIQLDKPLSCGRARVSQTSAKFHDGDSKSSSLPLDVSQSQLHPFVIEDLTSNRRFFYDGSYSGTNFESWQNFQNSYFCENLSKPKCNLKKMSQNPLTTLVVKDLTRDRRFFHDESYSGVNFPSWRNFQNLYVNEKVSKLERSSQKSSQILLQSDDDLLRNNDKIVNNSDFDDEQLQCYRDDKGDAERESFYVSSIDIDVIEYPIVWALQFFDIRKFVGAIIFFVLLKKATLWFLLMIFGEIDLFCLILLLLYVCTYFVVKF